MVKNRNYFFWVRLAIGLIILLALIYMIGIQALVSTVIRIHPLYAFYVLLCLFVLFFIGAINVWLLLTIFHSLGFAAFLSIYSYSWIASLFTPGQVGDASLILFLRKKYNIAVHQTGLVYLTDKIITLIFFLVIGFYGATVVIPGLYTLSKPFMWIVLSAIFLCLLGFIIFKIFDKNFQTNNKFESARKILLNWKVLLLNFFITLFKWLVVCAAFYFAFLAFGTTVSWPEIGIIPIISTLVGYIPVSIAGLGTVEITAGYLFLQVGVETSIVLSAYLLLRSLQYLLAVLLLGAVTGVKKR